MTDNVQVPGGGLAGWNLTLSPGIICEEVSRPQLKTAQRVADGGECSVRNVLHLGVRISPFFLSKFVPVSVEDFPLAGRRRRDGHFQEGHFPKLIIKMP